MALAMVPAGSSRPIEKIVPGPLCFDAHFGAPLPPAPGAAAPPRPPPLGTPLLLFVHLPYIDAHLLRFCAYFFCYLSSVNVNQNGPSYRLNGAGSR
jgi:hypothetical protein